MGGADLGLGSSGPEVQAVQDKLAEAAQAAKEESADSFGYHATAYNHERSKAGPFIALAEAVSSSGDFDQETADAISALQELAGLPVTGIADTSTKLKLDEWSQEFPISLARVDRSAPSSTDSDVVWKMDKDGQWVVDHGATARANLETAGKKALLGAGLTGVGSLLAIPRAMAEGGATFGQALGVGGLVVAGIVALTSGVDLVQSGYHAVMDALGFGFQPD
jgi:hypothetical protein